MKTAELNRLKGLKEAGTQAGGTPAFRQGRSAPANRREQRKLDQAKVLCLAVKLDGDLVKQLHARGTERYGSARSWPNSEKKARRLVEPLLPLGF